MTDKEDILAIIKTIRTEDKDAPATLLEIHDDIQKAKIFKLDSFEKKLHDLILIYLKYNNPLVKISTLNLLHTCILKDLFKSKSNVDLLIFVLDILQHDIQNVEDQAQWLKAFDIVLLSENLIKEILEDKYPQIIKVFHIGLKSKTASSLHKVKALALLSSLLKNTSESIITSFLDEIYEQLIALMFSSGNRTLQNEAISLGYQLLPNISLTLHKHWDKIVTVFKETYISGMTTFVTEGNSSFSKLWIFLTKLFGTRLHKAALMTNPMLTIVETAFKSQNFDIRKEAFHCWQALIESYSLGSKELLTPKRIKLLTIPLKTNNCKTEELIIVKFHTWCKLIDYINDRIDEYAKGVIDLFLNFCFGQLCDTPLASIMTPGLAAPGKKYPAVHLLTSKAFLQMIGRPKYVDDELNKSLDIFTFRGPIISQRIFVELSKVFVYAIGECCVLLSELEETDELAKINVALWQSLFCVVDSCDAGNEKKRIVEDVATIILALFTLAKKKPNVFNFGIIYILDIINSKEFKFFEEKLIWQSLLMPMIVAPVKKDWDSFSEEYTALCMNICLFKRGDSDNLFAIQAVAKKLFTINNEEHNSIKINLLLILWFILQKELRIELEKNKSEPMNEEKYVETFSILLVWPIAYFTRNIVSPASDKPNVNQDITGTWKELYNIFSSNTPEKIQARVQTVLLCYIYKILVDKPVFLSITEFVYTIVTNIKYQQFAEENCQNVRLVFDIIRNIFTLSSVSRKVMDVFQLCVAHLFDVCAGSVYLKQIIEQLVDCLDGIIAVYGKTHILKQVEFFLSKMHYSDEIRPALEKLLGIMKKIKDPATSDQIKTIVCTITEILKESNISSKDFGTNAEDPLPSVTTYEKDMEKQQRITLLGYDPDTMTPVKLEDSVLKNAKPPQPPAPITSVTKDTSDKTEFVLVNSPYKFDPKKLPKNQREKLSRRRDDIPALYQDLTQSLSNMTDSNTFSMESGAPSAIAITEEPKKVTPPEIPSNNEDDANTHHQSPEAVEALDLAFGKENERKRKKLSSLEKELQRIKIDCNDSGEYKNRATKRRTRSLYSNYAVYTMDQNETKVLRTKNTSDTLEAKPNQTKLPKTSNANTDSKDIPQITEPAENEKSENNAKTLTIVAMQYPFNDVKPGEEIDVSKIGVVKGPKEISPHKIVNKSSNCLNTQPSAEICKKITFASEEENVCDAKVICNTEPLSILQPNEADNISPLEINSDTTTAKAYNLPDNLNNTESMETLSISTEILAEINNEPSPQQIDNKINKDVCRTVFLDNSTDEIADSELLNKRPISPTNRNSIVSSPVNCDTPTRTNELMKSTRELSPIKINIEQDLKPVAATSTEQVLNTYVVPAENTESIVNCSPELFNSQDYQVYERTPATTSVQESLNKFTKDTTTEQLTASVQIKKNYLGGRSAQMMNMISAKSTLITTPVKKSKSNKKRLEKTTYSTPSQNRTKKMMEKLTNENKEPEKEVTETIAIDEDDFLTLCRPLPSASATPGPSILRKRKCPDPDDTVTSCPKKRKVNFNDPLVVREKYIEKIINIVSSDNGSRILRSAKNSLIQKEIHETQNYDDDSDISVADTLNKNEKTNDEINEVTDINSPTNSSASPHPVNNEAPACPELINSTDSVKDIVSYLGGYDLVEPLTAILHSRGIETIGQLARLTDTRDIEIPIKMSQLRKAFKLFLERKSNNQTKTIKKIKPITLSTKSIKKRNVFKSADELSTGCKNSTITKDLEKKSILASAQVCANIQNEIARNFAESVNEPGGSRDKELVKFARKENQKSDEGSNNESNIMNLTIKGITLRTIIQEILKKNLDRRPLIKLLAINIPPSFLMELVPVKELVKYSAKVCVFSDIVNEFDLQVIYNFLRELDASAKNHLQLNFFDIVKQLHSAIIENPRQKSVIDNLSTVQISHVIVKKCEENPNTDTFLMKLYADLNAQGHINHSVPKTIANGNVVTQATVVDPLEKYAPDDIARTLLPHLKNGRVSRDLVLNLHRTISSLLSVRDLVQLNYEEMLNKI